MVTLLKLKDIKKTIQFSTILMIFNFTFICANKIGNNNVDPMMLAFTSGQLMCLPLLFFAMFDDGFKDSYNFEHKHIFSEKIIKIFIVNFIFAILCSFFGMI